jgi:putative transposase
VFILIRWLKPTAMNISLYQILISPSVHCESKVKVFSLPSAFHCCLLIIAVCFSRRNKKINTFGFSQKQFIMSYVKIWVHLVFSTKNREPFITKENRQIIHNQIVANCKEKNIFLQAIDGYTEHLHCLISLGKDQTIAQVAQLIKGESSFWINKNKLIPFKFSWQDDYFAVSVGESQIEKVVNYIKNQETHHANKSFSEEVDEFVTKYGFILVND